MKFPFPQNKIFYAVLALSLCNSPALAAPTVQESIITLMEYVHQVSDPIEQFNRLFKAFLTNPSDKIPLSWYLDQLITLISNHKTRFEEYVTVKLPVVFDRAKGIVANTREQFIEILLNTLETLRESALINEQALAQAHQAEATSFMGKVSTFGKNIVTAGKNNITAVKLALAIEPFKGVLPTASAELYKKIEKKVLQANIVERLKAF